MKTLSIDIETYSPTDLKKAGVYRYSEDKDFDILLFAYAYDDGPVQVVDLSSYIIPVELVKDILDPKVLKSAFNAQFERVCLSRYILGTHRWYYRHLLKDFTGPFLPPEQWRCTMVHSRYLALPGDLDGTAKALKLTEGKDTAGKALIRYFSKPCKPTKKNGGATRNTPKSDPEKWAQFVEYNRQDVVVERAISRKLERWPVPVSEWKLWHLDQHINDRGVAVDRILVEQAIAMDSEHSSDVRDRMAEVTGLDNPNSVAQLKGWLADNGTEADSLAKDAVAGLIDDADGDVREALELRQALSRTSVKKYEAMASGMCSDGRVHGLLAFYGATRTGRWAGRLVQVQNLPRNYLHDLDLARNLVKAGDRESIELLFGDVPDVLSQLIRTALVPGVGRRFIISDFSAIEARVIAWVAGETWRMEVFATTGKIYEASASAMFHVPIESITKGDPLRQKGKVAELACIAEGELVLTDRGLVPIEQVTTEHLLWDGESWVTHKGVVYKGRREVITYEGLSATVDHLVWVEGESEPVHLGAAAACGAHLVRTADGRKTVSLGEGLPLIRAGSGAPEVLQDVYDILNAGKHNRFTVSGVLVHNCGYGGSVGALKNMGADKMGLSDAELKDIVRKWREASPHIVDLWWAVEEAAMIAIETQGEAKTHGVGFRYENGVLFVRLQSGRDLVYPSARIGIDEKFNTKCITYLGKDTGVWTRLHTYGPKIVENIIQALSRDCLAEAMLRLAGAGYKTVMHIHDEVVLEAPHGEGSLEEVNRIMGEPVSWAPGLLLGAAGFESDYYMKD
jgi:DNA polymerase